MQAGEDGQVWTSKDALRVAAYHPHPLVALVLTVSICGGKGSSGWEMCIGWAPLVPCLCSPPLTHDGAAGRPPHGKAQLALGERTLVLSRQVMSGLRRDACGPLFLCSV